MITQNVATELAMELINRSGLPATVDNVNRAVQAILTGNIDLTQRRGFTDKYSQPPAVSDVDAAVASLTNGVGAGAVDAVADRAVAGAGADTYDADVDVDSGTTSESTTPRRRAQPRQRKQPELGDGDTVEYAYPREPTVEETLDKSLRTADLRAPDGEPAQPPIRPDSIRTPGPPPAPVEVEGIGTVPSPVPEPVFPEEDVSIDDVVSARPSIQRPSIPPVEELQTQVADSVVEYRDSHPELVEEIEAANATQDWQRVADNILQLAQQVQDPLLATAGGLAATAATVYGIRGVQAYRRNQRRARGQRPPPPPPSQQALQPRPEPPPQPGPQPTPEPEPEPQPREQPRAQPRGRAAPPPRESANDIIDRVLEGEFEGRDRPPRTTQRRTPTTVEGEVVRPQLSEQRGLPPPDVPELPAPQRSLPETIAQSAVEQSPLALEAPQRAPATEEPIQFRSAIDGRQYVWDAEAGVLLREPLNRSGTGAWTRVPPDDAQRIVQQALNPSANTGMEFKHGATTYTVNDAGEVVASNKRTARRLSPEQFEEIASKWKRGSWSRKKAGSLVNFLNALRSVM